MHRLSPLARSAEFRGFTLIELAVVLLILAVLASFMLMPLAGREDLRRRNSAEAELKEIREALIGFAILYKRLPCPTRETNPAASGYGLEDPACNQASEGYLPWRTLGVQAFDPWGAPRASAADGWAGHWRYRVDPGFAVAPSDTSCGWPVWPIGPRTRFENAIAVRDSAGVELTVTSGSAPSLCPDGQEDRKAAVAVVFSAGPNGVADGENASFETSAPLYQQDVPSTSFDDILMWIGKPLLIARMGAAGSL